MNFNFLSELFHDDFAIVLNIRDIILVQQDKSHINKENQSDCTRMVTVTELR